MKLRTFIANSLTVDLASALRSANLAGAECELDEATRTISFCPNLCTAPEMVAQRLREHGFSEVSQPLAD